MWHDNSFIERIVILYADSAQADQSVAVASVGVRDNHLLHSPCVSAYKCTGDHIGVVD